MGFQHQKEHGQHFLQDSTVIGILVAEAHLSKNEAVLEIGAGTGNITTELAKCAGTVIAVENDFRLRDALSGMPKNVEVLFADAFKVLRKKHFQKIVGNIPFQLAEPLLHYLCMAKQVQKSVLIVPRTFAQKAQQHPFFSAFLEITLLQDVPKKAFHPQPRTHCCIITITLRKNIDDQAFLCQQIYLQRDKKLKNGLREALIEFSVRKGKTLTKKQALKIIDALSLPEKWLETLITRLPPKVYLTLSLQQKLFQRI